jgi:hypothetical protein
MTKKTNWRKTLKYSIATPLVKGYLAGLQKTSRMHVDGEAHLDTLLTIQQPFIPCFWHQQNLICALYLLSLRTRGLKAGFLVSPSRDGEIPAKIFTQWGATIIRGSSSKTGAQAMRELYKVIVQDKVSPANTPDGPRGPIFEFKPGPLMIAQMTGAPIVPIACATRQGWQLSSWDKFVLPGWFNDISVAIGQPVTIEKGLSMAELEPLRLRLQNTLNDLSLKTKNF